MLQLISVFICGIDSSTTLVVCEKDHSPGRPGTSVYDTERIWLAFQHSPNVCHISHQLQIPKSMLHDDVHTKLNLHGYKLQLVQHIQPCNMPWRLNFVAFMLEKLTADDSYLQKIIFSDKAIFHTHGVVNRLNCRIWGSENPCALKEHVRDNAKVSVCWNITLDCSPSNF